MLKLTPMMESNCVDFLDMWLTWRLKNKKSLLAKSFRTLLLVNIYHHVVLSRQQLRPRHCVDIEEYICCSIQIYSLLLSIFPFFPILQFFSVWIFQLCLMFSEDILIMKYSSSPQCFLSILLSSFCLIPLYLHV